MKWRLKLRAHGEVELVLGPHLDRAQAEEAARARAALPDWIECEVVELEPVDDGGRELEDLPVFLRGLLIAAMRGEP